MTDIGAVAVTVATATGTILDLRDVDQVVVVLVTEIEDTSVLVGHDRHLETVIVVGVAHGVVELHHGWSL